MTKPEGLIAVVLLFLPDFSILFLIMFTYMYRAAKDEKVEENGWTTWGYAITKIGVRLMTPIQQAMIDEDTSRKDIIINCVCTV